VTTRANLQKWQEKLMRIFHLRPLRRTAAVLVATVALVLSTSTVASAEEYQRLVFSADGTTYLGYGWWVSAFAGANQNGFIEVYDAFADGDNGIIMELSKMTGSEADPDWQRVNLVSVRGKGNVNRNSVKSEADGGPTYHQSVRIKVCKLLPDGTWKDCNSVTRLNI
jgi:hypothetical protein